MAINKEDIEHLKELAKLEFGKKESIKLAEDLAGILDFMKVLEEADISEVKEMTHPQDIKNVLREDGSKDYPRLSGRDRIAKAFPESESGGGVHDADDEVWLKVKAPIKIS